MLEGVLGVDLGYEGVTHGQVTGSICHTRAGTRSSFFRRQAKIDPVVSVGVD
ncbi:hypothetical protein J6590_020391 [Homalodisca vitripennis]|nr:hypothetical protein J6590_020391 [Homalodisca vitripennis]